MSRGRFLLVLAVGIGVVLGRPDAALAHSELVSSTPEPGADLATAPSLVVLRFSETLNVRLSTASVTAPDGTDTDGRAEGTQEISVRLVTTPAGLYRVTWTTVSLLDGHTLSGSFAFGVGVPVGPEASSDISTTPGMEDLPIVLARGVEDLALMLTAGFLLLGRLAGREPKLTWVRGRAVRSLVVAVVGGTTVVTAEALAATHGLSPGATFSYLTTGWPGVARLIRPALELAALVLAARRSRWTGAMVAGVILVLAAAGHAAAVSPKWWGVTLEAVHVGAAATWAGGIVALALQRPPGGWAETEGRTLLARFTPVALGAFAATAIAGVLRESQELGSLHELVASSYGITLLVKTLLVLLMTSLSVFAWRRVAVRPRLESGLAIAVVMAAALLAASPLPAARFGQAERAAGGDAVQNRALPRAGDLTLGGNAGEVLVGLTIRPIDPGRSDAFIYAFPPDGERPASQLSVRLFVGRRQMGLDPCGIACYQTELALSRSRRIEVRVGGRTGGIAVFDVPRVPAPPGEPLLAELGQRMRALTSYRLEETLQSGASLLETTYAFRAPDELQSRSSDGFRLIWIGGTRYLEERPGAGWIEESDGSLYSVPSFLWDYVPTEIVDPMIVGRARVGGVATTVLAFYGPNNGATIWFRLWVDRTGLVRRAQMRGPGHFMNDRYFAFDTPISIVSPIGAHV